MTITRVAIPVLRGKRRFHLTKGRSWSVVEHLVLIMLAKRSGTATEIAKEAQLPRRLVLESITRLMHASWVELSQTNDGIIFRASSKGHEAAQSDELRGHPKPTTRSINLIIDQVTGMIYRRRELTLFEKHLLEEREKQGQERIIWVQPREIDLADHVHNVIATLFEEDEQFVSMESNGARLVERYALFTVRNNKVQQLPARAPKELEQVIVDAAKQAEQAVPNVQLQFHLPAPVGTARAAVPRSVAFASDDVILGAEAHKTIFKRTIERCRHDLIVHSTFIAADRFDEWRPSIMKAINRGVLVHVLWGEDDEKSKQSETRRVVSNLRDQFASSGLGERIEFHPFSTRSHSKLVVADAGSPDQHIAIVGSCNWFTSGFASFEASVLLRDPTLVADVLDQLAALSVAPDGHWVEATGHFARLAHDVRREISPTGSRAEGCLVLGPDHATFVRRARDRVQKRLFVTSHRISAPARPAVIIPAIAAVAAKPDVDVSIYYGRPGERGDGQRTADMTWEANDAGVSVQPVREPRVHAKVLAWDDDSVVISSQNWLSADPSENNRRREIGVFMQSGGVARKIIREFEALRQIG